MRGFTLVELLVAVMIGLLLTVLISQVFVSSRRAYATTDDLSRMQENMRYTHDLLGRTIRMASYMSSPSSVPVGFDGMIGQFEGASRALNGTDGTGSAPDTLTVIYQGTADNATFDCVGTPIGAGVTAVNHFTVENIVVNGKTERGLVCRTDLAGTGTPTLLAADIDNMQVLYGEEAGSTWNVDRYVTRGDVANVDRVISVRMALLFRTASERMRLTPDTTAYNLLGTTLPAFTGSEATRIRRTMTVTFTIRNRSP
jgi:type IV pilus assembly protein PilW